MPDAVNGTKESNRMLSFVPFVVSGALAGALSGTDTGCLSASCRFGAGKRAGRERYEKVKGLPPYVPDDGGKPCGFVSDQTIPCSAMLRATFMKPAMLAPFM